MTHDPIHPRRRTVLAAAAASAIALPALAQARPLVVVTSFSRDVTGPIVAAFEKKHPGVKVQIQNRNTAAAVAFIRETRTAPPDVMWASAPDAFEVLKKDQLLQRFRPQATGIAEKVGAYPVNDPDGYFFGFAASGYGIMFNTRYLRANDLPAPKEWDDLAKPVYAGHVGISAPSRSGTTHLTIETILQGEGWDKGWALLLAMAGNFAAVSDRSFGVPDAVNSGQYGIGIVIDFFGFSAKASGFPVEFVYPSVTTLVPANVAIIANAPNTPAAQQFIEFLLSPEGQEILLDPKLMRLPVRPETYAKAPAGFPNPFRDASLGSRLTFDSTKSEQRYELVNSLFDRMITFRLRELNAAWKAIHAAEARLARRDNAEARRLVTEARAKATAVPITEAQSLDPAFTAIFQPTSADKPAPARQAQVEEQWDAFVRANLAEAQRLAEQSARAG
jgi:ABC-type Fe3+ transport system substrate-binding protein